MPTKYDFVNNFIITLPAISFNDFDEVKKQVLEALEETEIHFQEELEKQQQKKAFLEQLTALSKEIDINSLTLADIEQNELLKAIVETKQQQLVENTGKKRKPLVPKYKFFDLDGTSVKFWTGVGMKPKGVKKHLEEGGKIEDLEIATFNKKHKLTATTPDEIEVKK